MTILFVGDIHLKSARVLPAVDRAVAMTGADGVVVLGDVCDDWDATARATHAMVAAPDKDEGMRAFFEKRPPNWEAV